MFSGNKNEKDNLISLTISSIEDNDAYDSYQSDLEEAPDEFLNDNLKIFRYNAYKNHNVLNVCYSANNVMMLLSNGACVTWGLNRSTLGRKCSNAKMESYIPTPLKFKKKIGNIACGRNHCLAKSKNMSVFSWGQNTYGQVIEII
jgi:alpha-tubulin suppressor-like RCC1 family protein